MSTADKKTRKRKSSKFDVPEMNAEDWKVEEFDAAGGPASVEVDCPHCGDVFECSVMPSDDGSSERKTCKVCAQPVLVTAQKNGDDLMVSADRI